MSPRVKSPDGREPDPPPADQAPTAPPPADPPPTATAATLRALNAGALLAALRGAGPLTVTEIMAATGLSRPTVHLVCEDLIRAGWVRESADDGDRPDAQDAGSRTAPKVGRPARRYAFAADAGYVVGVDMGVGTVTAQVADLGGQVLGSASRRPANARVAAGDRLALVRRSVEAALRAAGLTADAVLAVGVGVPAPVDRSGRALASEDYLPGLAGADLPATLGTALGCPVLVENDANLAVLAERWRGVAVDLYDVVVLLAGERLGAGIVSDGRLLHGHRGSAGEMGFLALVEGVGAADGVAALAREHAAGAGLPAHSAEAVFAAARSGDATALGVVEHVASILARAITPLAVLLDPEVVVIGGAVADSCDVLLAPLEQRLAGLVPAPPRVVASALGARAVVVGAVRLALDYVEREVTPRTGAAEPRAVSPRSTAPRE